MKNSVIEGFEKRNFKPKKLPEFRPGDTVRVSYKIQEGAGDKAKSRIQDFEGVVIRKKKGTVEGSFTVRKIGAGGVGVERVFPFYGPNLDKVKVLSSGIVRRSRLFYLRELSGKSARIKSLFGGRKKAVEVPGADQKVEEVVAEQNISVEPKAPAPKKEIAAEPNKAKAKQEVEVKAEAKGEAKQEVEVKAEAKGKAKPDVEVKAEPNEAEAKQEVKAEAKPDTKPKS
jgi:large subunit ribosomal protein L19